MQMKSIFLSFLVLACITPCQAIDDKAAPTTIRPQPGVPRPKPIPRELIAYEGKLAGTVIWKGEDAVSFRMKISKDPRNPEGSIGKEVIISAMWDPSDGLLPHPNPAHVTFIRSLKSGTDLIIKIRNDEENFLHIVELPDAAAVKPEGEKRESKP